MDRDSARRALGERGVPFDEARLVGSIKSGDLALVELLLAAGVSASARSDDEVPAVALAASLGRGDIASALLGAGADPADLVQAIVRKPKRKDVWERLASLSGVFTFAASLIVAAVGWYFTSTYNQRQLHQDRTLRNQQNRVLEMQTMERMIPHLAGNEQSKKVALLVISQLARPALATSMAELLGGQGSIDAARTIAVAGESQAKAQAVSALTGIAATGTEAAATAARDALGAVFKGKERALVKIERDDGGSCSGFLVDAKEGWFATAGYCMSGFPKTKFTIETADRKRFPVQQVIPQSKADLDGNYFATPVVMIRADARDLVPLALAARPTRLGARVVGIGFGADGNLKAAVGVVAAIDVTLRETKDRYVTVKFEGREDIAGTGGGPFINDEGDVVCMIFAGTDTDHECVPADLIRRALTRVLGSDPAR